MGAAGLSVGPDATASSSAGARSWTWCAFDFMGILARCGRPAPRIRGTR